jgi:peptide/nickel transport system substrate-binding protein
MNKKILCIALSLALIFSMIPIASVSATLPRDKEITIGTIGEPYTVDPACTYDTASLELVWNVYDTLIGFYVNRTNPDRTKQGLANKFEASLAYEWVIDKTTDPLHPVYYFKIRGSHDHFISVVSFLPPIPYGVPITVPVSTTWMEIPASEEPGCPWHIWKWEDNNKDGVLSACDIVKMDKLVWQGLDSVDAPWLAFHVQEVVEYEGLVAMVLKELPVPFQQLRTLTLPQGFNPYLPVSNIVTEVDPVGGRPYHIDDWEDGMFGPYNGMLSVNDTITMTRQDPIPVGFEYPGAWTRDYVVEAITPTLLIVKPCLTCWDVEYSFERWFVTDQAGGPQWMIYEVLAYPEYEWPHLDGTIDPAFAATVDAAIETNCTWVWFTFAIPYATAVFEQVMASSWASILYTDWAIDHLCWDGIWANIDAYHDPTVSPLDVDPIMCGTGPFYFVEWVSGSHWRIERFVEHWQQWPARYCNGYVDVVKEEFISEWPTRKLMFLAGDLDFNYVPRQYKNDVLGKPGIRCDYPLEGVTIDAIFYNLNMSHASRYLYPPFIEHLEYGQIKGTGIPPDFFSDKWLRKAFSYCINYTEFQLTAYLGESIYPYTPMPDAGVFAQFRHDPAWYPANGYNKDLAKATYCFKMAYGGTDPTPEDWTNGDETPGLVWTTGFTLPVVYNVGNVPRKAIAEDYIKRVVQGINNKFKVDTYEIEWGTVMLPELRAHKLTMFVIGWIPDYLDPHNYMYTFMGAGGAFSHYQAYQDDYVDLLLDQGMKELNTTRRIEIYQELEEIYIEDCPSVCTDQPIGRHWERDWVQGWYYNPIYGGGYFKHYWKAEPATMEPVDMSAESTISDVTDKCIVVDVNGVARFKFSVDVSAERVDSNGLIITFQGILALTRTLGDKFAAINGTIETLTVGGPGSTIEWTFTNIIDSGWPTKITVAVQNQYCKIGLTTGVASGYCYDSAPENNTMFSAGNATVVYCDIDCNAKVDYLDDRLFGKDYIDFGKVPPVYVKRSDFNKDKKVDYLDDRLFGKAYIAYGKYA